MSSHVWYASYGSNLSRDRFERYLRGGTPVGGRRRYTGARDRTPPNDDQPLVLPCRLWFCGVSLTWGGGMAFIDTSRTGRTLGRMYLLSAEQFADVHAQENGGDAKPADLVAMAPGQRVQAGGGNYPIVVCCGLADEVPIFTFTTDRPPRPTAPARAYMQTMACGLAESHDMSAGAIVNYLRAVPTVRDAYDMAALSAIAHAGVASAIVAPPRHSSPS